MSEIYGAVFEFIDRVGLSEINILAVCLPFILAAAIISFIARRNIGKKRFGERFKEERRRVLPKEIILALFIIWCGTVGVLTLIPVRLEGNILHFVSTGVWLPLNSFGIDLVPHFRFSSDIFSGRFKTHELLNVLMFVPFGMFFPFLYKEPRLWKTAFWGFIVSVGIERRQMFIDRESDIDDVITNTLGAVCGYLVFLLIRRVFPKFAERRAGKTDHGEKEN